MTKHKILRDNDMRLYVNVWIEELGLKNVEGMTAVQLLNHIKTNEVSKPLSISRLRGKYEEQFPELRGDTYEARQRHSGTVKQEVIEFRDDEPVKSDNTIEVHPDQIKLFDDELGK
jgi:hypothetical protein